MWLSLIALAAAASVSRAPILVNIGDPVDDIALVYAVSGQEPVKEFAAEIKALEKTLLANDKKRIEKLLGKPGRGPGKDYALPVGQHRKFMISGLRYDDPKMNKDHTAYYPIGDFANIGVRYGVDGTSAQFAVLYFKVDNAFPKLKKLEREGHQETDRDPVTNIAERLKWDHEKFAKVKKYIEERSRQIPSPIPSPKRGN
jgi:hypothetical protein